MGEDGEEKRLRRIASPILRQSGLGLGWGGKGVGMMAPQTSRDGDG